ncbi:hypothetical protein SETIT_9G159000v2 [Setaria italica]|uniref:DUF7595 domain-containing protein n=1 Tax=Setaria italica TaxID=4555 RepID=K4AJN1_SETIT|nr:hypothetical protein SETIT_9G159000v2 [Setaria italica]
MKERWAVSAPPSTKKALALRARATPPRKRRRAFISPPSPDQTQTTPQRPPETEEAEPPAPTLPYDLLPEIAARSDVTTLVRCAACCKALRREILRPAFIRRVCREPASGAVVPPCALGFLHAYDKARMEAEQDQPPPAPCFSVAHPACGVLLRGAPRAVRGPYLGGDRSSEMCVYDPMSGDRTFLPSPPYGMRVSDRKASDYGVSYTYVLLTAADGVGGGSFHVLAADFSGLMLHSANIMVQTVSSDNAGDGACAWGPVTMAAHPRSRRSYLQPHCGAVVLCGLIHWLMYDYYGQFHILTYNARTAMAGSIELPKGSLPDHCKVSNLHLASSPDGRLSLHVADKRRYQFGCCGLPVPPATVGGGSEGEQDLAVLDVETKELRRVIKKKNITAFPYEIDLEARLSAMKTF